jgi:DNA-binding transcriptional LysR family regulator
VEWSDIRVFLYVARAGQMAGASRALGLDHSTISRRIARLEEGTGASLFDRAGRRLSLTDQGKTLLAAAEKLEAIIIRDVLSLGETQREIGGRVRIGTSEGLGAHYLANRLPALLRAHPALELELVALPRTYSLGMREVDVAITMDRPDAGDVRFKKLSAYELGIYASRAYLEREGHPETVESLTGRAWCGYVDELLFTDELDLLAFGDVVIRPRYRTTSVTAQLGVALGGTALVVLPCYMAAPHPELERVLPDAVRIERTYWLSVHGDLADSPRVRLVMGEIERQVRGDRGLFLPQAGTESAPAPMT